ncbi:MAG: hypothetical protein IGBAC_0533 [Ignavibacteriae bacterium]|nr:MAG: hypothetical protein IGBAC_0533 [Ignavibacteriota bacterium]
METITILIIEPTELTFEVLNKQFKKALKANVIIDNINYIQIENFVKNKIPIYDLVFIGELIDLKDTIKISSTLKRNGFFMPLILLTQIQDTKLTIQQIEAGIDDCLNIYEFESETFAWSLTSLIQKSEIKQKAEEFETIRAKILSLYSSLAKITHEINNPLGVMRLALFQLKSKINNDESLNKYIQMISDNIDKIENQITDLRKVREEMQIEQTILRKILAIKE